MKTVHQGASISVWCATSPMLNAMGGVYWEDCDMAALRTDDPGQPGVKPWAADTELAERLWRILEQMTGMALP
ncbi:MULTISPECIES: hypothetical protein [unclassified Rhizobium]|uniref:hypothetical protein n=1 Tax=unclassified Rhizobium TaxID=2613769 RepID=UPI00084CA194|nr:MULTISPECIES: hypothetical protein [unclassified Rhizobium]OEC95101.1 hypothetical protein A9Z06_32180 [Rhizobium sp. YK2]QYA16030.1 hypothetical protein J5284_29050 [Rhizobium sp. AB2/73]UEQ84573.1 hypothetical protein I8E17_30380 [Rhizobium sp. AB2/73]